MDIFVGGEYASYSRLDRTTISSPADGAEVDSGPRVGPEEVDEAVKNAHETFLSWRNMLGSEGEYVLGPPEVILGLLPGNGGTQRLHRLLGTSRALDLMVTGRTLSPGEAHEFGILDRLFPADELEGKPREYVEKLAAGASGAIGSIKLALHGGIERPLDEGLVTERELVEPLFDSNDARRASPRSWRSVSRSPAGRVLQSGAGEVRESWPHPTP